MIEILTKIGVKITIIVVKNRKPYYFIIIYKCKEVPLSLFSYQMLASTFDSSKRSSCYKASYTLARRMVQEPLVNGLRTKCTCVWTGLQTCAVPSSNGSHTVCHKLKFVSFLRKHKENCIRPHAPDVLCSPQVRRKLMNHTPLTRRMQTAQRAKSHPH